METLITLALIGIAFFTGRLAEQRHYKKIKRREKQLAHIPAVSFSTIDPKRQVEESKLACGSVVVSVDYFKRILMAFRQLFGGEIQSYASLIDRGRREAMLRMKESVPNADIFINCRMETASISKGENNAIGSVEIVAYATAVRYVS